MKKKKTACEGTLGPWAQEDTEKKYEKEERKKLALK